jgi:parallel beta-helix repeat protein
MRLATFLKPATTTPSTRHREALSGTRLAGLLLAATALGTTAAIAPSAASAAGTTAYVATTGSDSTGDGSATRPFKTIQTAVDKAGTGSRIIVAAGTYPGFVVTRDNLTVAAATGAKVLIRGTGTNIVTFDGVVGGGLESLDILGSTVQYGSAVKIDDSSGVEVTRSMIHDGLTWGITVVRSAGVSLEDNEVYGNANGIEERYASDLVIRGNKIHHNLKPVDSGRGYEGINFYKSTGKVTVENNQLWDNRTHFEVYGASNLVIRNNITANGQVVETGTSSGYACANNVFTRNVSYRGTTPSNGMILRCASDNLVSHNTFDGFDTFALDVVDGTQGVAYGGSIERLRILNNVVTGGRALSIDNKLPASVDIDYNLLYNVGSTAEYGQYVAYVAGKGNTTSHAELVSWTGYQRNGIFASPGYVSASTRDYRLTSTSPAIDRGVLGLESTFLGAAPDLGRYETR